MDFLLSSLISYQCCLAPIHPTRPMEKLQVSDDEAEGTANQCKTQGVSGWMEKGIVSGKCITNYDVIRLCPPLYLLLEPVMGLEPYSLAEASSIHIRWEQDCTASAILSYIVTLW